MAVVNSLLVRIPMIDYFVQKYSTRANMPIRDPDRPPIDARESRMVEIMDFPFSRTSTSFFLSLMDNLNLRPSNSVLNFSVTTLLTLSIIVWMCAFYGSAAL